MTPPGQPEERSYAATRSDEKRTMPAPCVAIQSVPSRSTKTVFTSRSESPSLSVKEEISPL